MGLLIKCSWGHKMEFCRFRRVPPTPCHWGWSCHLYSMSTVEATVKSQIWHSSSWEPACPTAAGVYFDILPSLRDQWFILAKILSFFVYDVFVIITHRDRKYTLNQRLVHSAVFPRARTDGVGIKVWKWEWLHSNITPYNSHGNAFFS